MKLSEEKQIEFENMAEEGLGNMPLMGLTVCVVIKCLEGNGQKIRAKKYADKFKQVLEELNRMRVELVEEEVETEKEVADMLTPNRM